MKKKLILMFLLMIPFIINAEEIEDTTAIYGSNQTENDSFYGPSEMKAGPQILDTVSSPVTYEEGSQFSFEEKLDVTRYIKGIFIAGGIDAKIHGISDYGVFGGVDLEIDSKINNELFVLAENAKLKTNVDRDTYIVASEVEISGTYGGKMEVYAEDIEIQNATINGTLKVLCNKLELDDNVMINSINYNDNCVVSGLNNANIGSVETYHKEVSTENKTIGNSIKDILFSTFSLIFVAYVILFAFPDIYKKLNKKLNIKELIKSTLTGLGLVIVIPIVSIFAMLTVIAIPASIIALILYGILLYIAKLTIIAVIGNMLCTKLFNKKDKPYLAILIGVIAYELVILIPYIGVLVKLIALFIGFAYVKDLLFKTK